MKYLLLTCRRLAPLALAAPLVACASDGPYESYGGPPPDSYHDAYRAPPRDEYREPYREPYRDAWRSGGERSSNIARESIGVYRTHMGAEIASARYASVGGAVIEGVDEDGRRAWRVQVIGRIGESPQSLHRRLLAAR